MQNLKYSLKSIKVFLWFGYQQSTVYNRLSLNSPEQSKNVVTRWKSYTIK